jgi:hypothetical protein
LCVRLFVFVFRTAHVLCAPVCALPGVGCELRKTVFVCVRRAACPACLCGRVGWPEPQVDTVPEPEVGSPLADTPLTAEGCKRPPNLAKAARVPGSAAKRAVAVDAAGGSPKSRPPPKAGGGTAASASSKKKV